MNYKEDKTNPSDDIQDLPIIELEEKEQCEGLDFSGSVYENLPDFIKEGFLITTFKQNSNA